MDVIIVSKTHMSSGVCIGAVSGSGQFLRLLNESGYPHNSEVPINVGDVLTVSVANKSHLRAPHVEDVKLLWSKRKFTVDNQQKISHYLKEKIRVKIWQGGTDVLFDRKLQWTPSGSGYICEEKGLPEHSVGFWQTDRDLKRNDFKSKVRYAYPGFGRRNITFVGFQDPVRIIPAGTLLRVSLARWWSPDDETEERCYLQLSGWYADLSDNKVDEDDDLPF